MQGSTLIYPNYAIYTSGTLLIIMGAAFHGCGHTFDFKLLDEIYSESSECQDRVTYHRNFILSLIAWVKKKKTDSYLPRHGDGPHNQVTSIE